MFAKLKEKTSGSQKSPLSNHDRLRLKHPTEDLLQSISESSTADSHTAMAASGKQLSRQSSVSSLVSDLSMVSTSQFVNDSPMPNIDAELGTFDMEDSAFPQLSTDLSTQDIYSSLVRESRQKLSNAKFKFQDLLNAYHELQKQNLKMKEGLAKSQDRAFKKISELKEAEKLTRSQLDKSQQRVLDLEQEITLKQPSESEVESLNSKVAELELKLQEGAKEAAESKADQERLANSVSTLKSERSKVEEGLKLSTEKAIELKKQLNEKETIHSLALAECKRGFHNLLEERDVELKKIRQQLDETRKQSGEMTATVTSLKAENKAVKDKLEATVKRLESEKDELIQDISRAKDAACEAMKSDFESKVQSLRDSWEKEAQKKMQDVEAARHQKYAEEKEQTKLALEESWLAKKASDSKHEEELEVLQNRISQLSVELDSTRMNLQRRTVEVDQLRTSQEHSTLQATADVEEAISQCRRELESQHRAEMKKVRGELQERFESQLSEEKSKVVSVEKEMLQSLWSQVKSTLGIDCDMPEPDTLPAIIKLTLASFSDLNNEKQNVEKASEENRVQLESEIKKALGKNESLQCVIDSQSDRIESLQLHSSQVSNKLDEMASLQAANENLQRQLAERESRLRILESVTSEKSQNDSDEVKSLHSAVESLNKELAESTAKVESLEAKRSDLERELEANRCLQVEVDEVKRRLDARESELKSLEKKYAEKTQCDSTQISTLEKEVGVLRDKLAVKGNQLELLNTQCQKQARELEETAMLKTEKDDLEKKLSYQSNVVMALEARVSGMEKSGADEVGKLNSLVASQSEEIVSRSERIQLLEDQVRQFGQLESDNNGLKKQLENLAEEKTSLETKEKEVKTELAVLKSELKKQCSRLADIVPGNVSGLSEMVGSVLECHYSSLAQLDANTKEKELLNQSIENLQSEVHKVESKLEYVNIHYGAKVDALNADIDDLKSRLNQEIQLAYGLKKSLESSESDRLGRIAELESEIGKAREDEEAISQKLRDAIENWEDERLKSAQTAGERDGLRRELNTCKEKAASERAEWSDREKQISDERNRLTEELKSSTIEVRRLETKFSVLDAELSELRTSDKKSREEVRQSARTIEDLRTKCATLEMDLVECREKMALSQELVGKLRAELESSRKVTEDTHSRFTALKTQSARKMKLLGDEKCELEKQLATSLQELDALKASADSESNQSIDTMRPSVEELQSTVADLTARIDSVSKTIADKEIRIAELELELSDKDNHYQAELRRLETENEKARSETEQRLRFEMKRAISDFERQLAERDGQISKLTVAEYNRSGIPDPERQLRSLEKELSEKNAAVEQLVVMYEKQMRDQATELRQEASTRVQTQNEKHHAEVEGLMEEFRNETKQWVLERQKLHEEVDSAKHDRDQMVHELKRLSDLLDSSRTTTNGSSPKLAKSSSHSPMLLTLSGQNNQSSVLSGSAMSPGLGLGMPLHEATEYEYLRNILLEYMMGRETSVLWRVIGTIMRFSEDQMTEIAAREDTRPVRR